MLSLQEISDRLELQDLTYAYAAAVDSKNFEDLEAVFTPDAHIDCSVFGGPSGGVAELLAWTRVGLPTFAESHHMMTNQRFVINGDQATGHVMCFNPMVRAEAQENPGYIDFFGLYYVDEYRRTENGWRISSRRQEKTYILTGLHSA